MGFRGPRSLVAMRKRMQTLRRRPGAEDDCECGPDVLLTEDRAPILTELDEYMLEERIAS